MFRCENICKGPETVGNRRSMYHIAPTIPIAAKLQQMYLAGSMLPWKQPYGFIASPVWSGSFTQVTTALHPNDRACSSGWWYQMVHSSCTDTAVNIPRLRIQYDNRHLTSWLPQGKTKKNTLWGYRKFCHCISLYISIMRWRNKNIAVRK